MSVLSWNALCAAIGRMTFTDHVIKSMNEVTSSSPNLTRVTSWLLQIERWTVKNFMTK